MELSGYPPERWASEPNFFFSIVHPDDVHAVRGEHLDAARSGAPYKGEFRLVRPDGATVWVQAEDQLCGRRRQGPLPAGLHAGHHRAAHHRAAAPGNRLAPGDARLEPADRGAARGRAPPRGADQPRLLRDLLDPRRAGSADRPGLRRGGRGIERSRGGARALPRPHQRDPRAARTGPRARRSSSPTAASSNATTCRC